MSSSPQSAAADKYQVDQARLAQLLAGVALPGMATAGNRAWDQLQGFNGIPKDIATAFDTARTQMNAAYDQAGVSGAQATKQQALQSGGVFNTGQIDSALKQQAFGLQREREAQAANLQFQEAQAGMNQFNILTDFLGNAAQGTLGLGRGFSQSQGGAIGMMSQSNPLGGALSGAASGAAMGTTISPGWGTVIGGVVGGAAGYFGSR